MQHTAARCKVQERGAGGSATACGLWKCHVPCALQKLQLPPPPRWHRAAAALAPARHPDNPNKTLCGGVPFPRGTPPRRPTCIAPMVKYWSQVCTAQFNRPLWNLMQANYGGGIFAVSAVSSLLLRARGLPRPLIRRAGCFVRVCCCVQRDVVGAVGEAAGCEAA